MVWGGRREEGSGWGTRVYLWRIHFDIWQNQYNIVKLKNKVKLKTNKKTNKLLNLGPRPNNHLCNGKSSLLGEPPFYSRFSQNFFYSL